MLFGHFSRGKYLIEADHLPMSALGHYQPLSIHPGQWLLTANSGRSPLCNFRPYGVYQIGDV